MISRCDQFDQRNVQSTHPPANVHGLGAAAKGKYLEPWRRVQLWNERRASNKNRKKAEKEEAKEEKKRRKEAKKEKKREAKRMAQEKKRADKAETTATNNNTFVEERKMSRAAAAVKLVATVPVFHLVHPHHAHDKAVAKLKREVRAELWPTSEQQQQAEAVAPCGQGPEAAGPEGAEAGLAPTPGDVAAAEESRVPASAPRDEVSPPFNADKEAGPTPSKEEGEERRGIGVAAGPHRETSVAGAHTGEGAVEAAVVPAEEEDWLATMKEMARKLSEEPAAVERAEATGAEKRRLRQDEAEREPRGVQEQPGAALDLNETQQRSLELSAARGEAAEADGGLGGCPGRVGDGEEVEVGARIVACRRRHLCPAVFAPTYCVQSDFKNTLPALAASSTSPTEQNHLVTILFLAVQRCWASTMYVSHQDWHGRFVGFNRFSFGASVSRWFGRSVVL